MTDSKDLLCQFEEIYQWAELLQNKILHEGKSISDENIYMAKVAGIDKIERVRILKVDKINLPDIQLINDLKRANKLDAFATAGMAIGYGILLDKRAENKVLIHEFRHVAQYELFGDLKQFSLVYLRELIKFGYGHGPFEIDAKMYSQLI